MFPAALERDEPNLALTALEPGGCAPVELRQVFRQGQVIPQGQVALGTRHTDRFPLRFLSRTFSGLSEGLQMLPQCGRSKCFSTVTTLAEKIQILFKYIKKSIQI